MDDSYRDGEGDDGGNWLLWRFVDGALSISVSMLLAALPIRLGSSNKRPVQHYRPQAAKQVDFFRQFGEQTFVIISRARGKKRAG